MCEVHDDTIRSADMLQMRDSGEHVATCIPRRTVLATSAEVRSVVPVNVSNHAAVVLSYFHDGHRGALRSRSHQSAQVHQATPAIGSSMSNGGLSPSSFALSTSPTASSSASTPSLVTVPPISLEAA